MKDFQDTEECARLVNRYRDEIMSGEMSRRELARSAGITRHKAAIVFDMLHSGSVGEGGAGDRKGAIEERMRALNQAAEEAMRRMLQKPLPGERELRIGADSPDLLEIRGGRRKDDFDVEALVERAMKVFDDEDSRQARRQTRRVVINRGPVGIVFAGDEHFGGRGTNIRRAITEARIVNETPGLYHARMGDFVDQFILGRMRAIRDNAPFSIKEEWVMAKMLIELIAPKLLAVVGGNHDFWAAKASGMDRLADILPDGILYDTHDLGFDVEIGGGVRRVKMRHQWRGSSIFNPTHGIEVAARRDVADFDIGVGAHTHIAALVREFIAQGEKKLAVLTNTYKQYDEYASEIGFPRSHKTSTCATVIIEDDGTMFGAPSLDWASSYMKMRHRVN